MNKSNDLADNNDKLWDGRFSEATDAFVEAFTASVEFDKILALYDIKGSVAHATMLTRVGVITEEELQAIETDLKKLVKKLKPIVSAGQSHLKTYT